MRPLAPFAFNARRLTHFDLGDELLLDQTPPTTAACFQTQPPIPKPHASPLSINQRLPPLASPHARSYPVSSSPGGGGPQVVVLPTSSLGLCCTCFFPLFSLLRRFRLRYGERRVASRWRALEHWIDRPTDRSTIDGPNASVDRSNARVGVGVEFASPSSAGIIGTNEGTRATPNSNSGSGYGESRDGQGSKQGRRCIGFSIDTQTSID